MIRRIIVAQVGANKNEEEDSKEFKQIIMPGRNHEAHRKEKFGRGRTVGVFGEQTEKSRREGLHENGALPQDLWRAQKHRFGVALGAVCSRSRGRHRGCQEGGHQTQLPHGRRLHPVLQAGLNLKEASRVHR